jgi:FKBP-type peptidyl-prolyl cis-trans isomerase
VIAGWREGLQLFGKGGKGTLFIPSQLAYGNTPMSGIPANSVLIFDIHLINI